MTRKQFRKYFKLTNDEYCGRAKIYKYLSGINKLKYIPEDFSPYYATNLKLNSLVEIPKGFNPVMLFGDNLYLMSITEIPDHFNPTNITGTIYIGPVKTIPDRLKHLKFEIIFTNNEK